MLILYWLGAIADHQHQHWCTEEEYDSKVEVMNPTHQVRAVRGENTAAGTEPELGQHPAQTHPQAAYQAPERTLEVNAGRWLFFFFLSAVMRMIMSPCMNVPSHRFVDPLHKHGQEEDWGDRRSEVARDRLDVIKQLTALSCLDDRDPADTDGYDAQNPDSRDERRNDNSKDMGGWWCFHNDVNE